MVQLRLLGAMLNRHAFFFAGAAMGIALTSIVGRPSLVVGWVWVKLAAAALCEGFGALMDACRKQLRLMAALAPCPPGAG